MASRSINRVSPAIIRVIDISLKACSRLRALYKLNLPTTSAEDCYKAKRPFSNTIPENCSISSYRCRRLRKHRTSFESVLTTSPALSLLGSQILRLAPQSSYKSVDQDELPFLQQTRSVKLSLVTGGATTKIHYLTKVKKQIP
eukprot:IDg7404t1